jgi:hypothetical protein
MDDLAQADLRAVTAGFTGTGRGMTQGQQDQLFDVLSALYRKGYRRFRHGDCIGADAQAARIAKDIGFYLICHPGHPKDPNETKYRAFTDFNDEVLEPKPFLVRDRDIVDGSGVLVAAPYQDYEVRRSGTWTTTRYARSKGLKNILIYMVYSGRKYQQREA